MASGPPPPEPQRGLGIAVRILRERVGLSPSELAERAGIPAPSLTQIETGEEDPRWGDMRRVAQGLGVSMELLAEVAEANEKSERRN